jgi:hypothetical protein
MKSRERIHLPVRRPENIKPDVFDTHYELRKGGLFDV